MIRHDYPNLQKWLLHIYYDQSPAETRDAFAKTTYFEAVSCTFSGPIVVERRDLRHAY